MRTFTSNRGLRCCTTHSYTRFRRTSCSQDCLSHKYWPYLEHTEGENRIHTNPICHMPHYIQSNHEERKQSRRSLKGNEAGVRSDWFSQTWNFASTITNQRENSPCKKEASDSRFRTVVDRSMIIVIDQTQGTVVIHQQTKNITTILTSSKMSSGISLITRINQRDIDHSCLFTLTFSFKKYSTIFSCPASAATITTSNQALFPTRCQSIKVGLIK